MTEQAIGAYSKQKRQKLDSPLFNALLEIIPIEETIIDIGAQNGEMTKAFLDKGYDIFGIDGIPNIEEKTNGLIKWFDLTKDCSVFFDCADWGLFIEVGEHIPNEYENTVIDNVCRMAKRVLVVSWGALKQRGYKHINLHTQVYIASEFARRNWFVDENLTSSVRLNIESHKSKNERIMILKKGV